MAIMFFIITFISLISYLIFVEYSYRIKKASIEKDVIRLKKSILKFHSDQYVDYEILNLCNKYIKCRGFMTMVIFTNSNFDHFKEINFLPGLFQSFSLELNVGIYDEIFFHVNGDQIIPTSSQFGENISLNQFMHIVLNLDNVTIVKINNSIEENFELSNFDKLFILSCWIIKLIMHSPKNICHICNWDSVVSTNSSGRKIGKLFAVFTNPCIFNNNSFDFPKLNEIVYIQDKKIYIKSKSPVTFESGDKTISYDNDVKDKYISIPMERDLLDIFLSDKEIIIRRISEDDIYIRDCHGFKNIYNKTIWKN